MADELVFGVVSGDPMARPSLQRICDALTPTLGQPVRAKILDAYATLAEELREGSLALGWGPPLLILQLASQRAVEPLCQLVRRTGASYHSALFSRADSGIRHVADLSGKRAAWVDPESLSGHVLARRWIEIRGFDPYRLLASQRFFKTHSAVARAVLTGEADVGATYVNLHPGHGGIVDAGWSEVGGNERDVYVIATSGPVPSDAIVASSALAREQRQLVRTALGRLPADALAAVRVLFHAERLAPAAADYLEALGELAAPDGSGGLDARGSWRPPAAS